MLNKYLALPPLLVLSMMLAAIIVASAQAAPASNSRLLLSTDRSEYYFVVGNEASIYINVTNPYGVDLNGMLSHTITQKIQTANSVMQSTSSNSQSFSIANSSAGFGIKLGTSQNPGELDLSLTYDYSEPASAGGKRMQTTLNGIKIFFVQDEKQQSQKQEEQKSQESQQSEQSGEKSTTKSQDELKQEYEKQKQAEEDARQKQMQEEMQRQAEANKLDNRLQNNQGYQDSNSLKEQLAKEMQKKQQMTDDFKKAIEANSEFQQAMQDIMSQGYNQTGADINPINSTSGDFKVNFQDKNGNNMSLEGSMENKNLTSLTRSIEQSDDYIRRLIERDSRYKKYDNILNGEGLNQSSWQIARLDGNATGITVPYVGKANKTAEISAIVENGSIRDIKLVRPRSSLWLLVGVSAILLAALGGYIYYRYWKAKSEAKQEDPGEIRHIREFDYLKESKRLLRLATELFKKKEHKEAYSMASQAIRLYYSHEIGTGKEVTSHELIEVLKRKGMEHEKTRKCLNMCSLVEFAKYEANRKDFSEIVSLAESIIV